MDCEKLIISEDFVCAADGINLAKRACAVFSCYVFRCVKNRSVMKKLLLLTSVIAMPFVCAAGQTAKERELSKVLSDAVASMKVSLPMTLDEDTRLDSVSTVRNFMVYNNTMVKYDSVQIDAATFDTLLEDAVLKPLCSNKELQGFIDAEVIMVYRYFGKDGKFITEISKDMSTCKKT